MPGLLDSIGQGLQYISNDAKEDRKFERDLGKEEKKLRLAQKLEEEFTARKYELAQKFPEIKSTINNGAGTIFGILSNNTIKELHKNQDIEDAVVAGKMAPAERVGLAAQRIPYQNALDEARAGGAAASAGLATTRADDIGATQPARISEAEARAEKLKADAAKASDPSALTPAQRAALAKDLDDAAAAGLATKKDRAAYKFAKLSATEQEALREQAIKANPRRFAPLASGATAPGQLLDQEIDTTSMFNELP